MAVIVEEGFKRRYVYPMSNATNGGEAHSEYNVRGALSNILSYSAAFSKSDFTVSRCAYNSAYSGAAVQTNKVLELVIGAGRGNCNSYFVNCSALGTSDTPAVFAFDPEEVVISDNANLNYKISDCSDININFGLYVSVIYNQTIADGVVYRFISMGGDTTFVVNGTTYDVATEYTKIYENSYKPQGFNDIGILLGTMMYEKVDGVGEFGPFIPNPDITKCIDIYRLGSEDGIVDTLSRLITRLRVLNIYGGNFFVSDTLDDEGNDLKSDGVIKLYGGDYRLRIHEDVRDGSTNRKKKIIGGLDLVDVNLGGAINVIQDLFTFETYDFTIDPDDPSYQNDIQIKNIVFNPDVIFGNISANDANISNTLTAATIVADSANVSQTLVVGGCTITYGSDNILNFTEGIRAPKVYGAVWM